MSLDTMRPRAAWRSGPRNSTLIELLGPDPTASLSGATIAQVERRYDPATGDTRWGGHAWPGHGDRWWVIDAPNRVRAKALAEAVCSQDWATLGPAIDRLDVLPP